MTLRTFLAVVGLLLVVTSAPADEPVGNPDDTKADALGIIPESVSAAVAVRNASELTRRGDKFIEQTGMKVPLRASDAFRWLTDFLGIRKGLDDDGAFALMVMSPDFKLTSLVLAVPVKDFDAMAGNLKIPRDQLMPGQVIDRNGMGGVNPMPYVRYVSVRGYHLLLGGDKKKVQEAASAPALNASLPSDLERTLSEDDILLYARQFGSDNLNQAVYRIVDSLPPPTNESQSETVKQLTKAAMDLRSVIAGIRLDDGLGATLALNFDGEKSREFLMQIASNSSSLSLAGLPQGRAIAVHSSRGDGDNSGELARVLLHILFGRMVSATKSSLPDPQESAFADIFGVGWEHLNGSRTGLYENRNPERDGAFSFLAVLEADEAGSFVADMKSLARFVNASAMPAEERAKVIDAETIQTLVEELGSSKYRVRRLAAIKLDLLGKPALAALNGVRDSTDTETRLRARTIIQRISSAESEAREEFLEKNLLATIEPRFVYLPNQESRSGQSIDLIQMRLLSRDPSLADKLEALFGPEWSSLRLTTIGNQVLIFWGTETTIMDQAIVDLRAGQTRLELSKRFTAFRQRGAPKRTAEFHLSLVRLRQLVDRKADLIQSDKLSTSMTSFGMSIAPQMIRFDLFSPYDNAKVIIGEFE